MAADLTSFKIRVLEPGDEQALEAFLGERLEQSMFLLSNMRAGGLRDQGRVYQGTYLGAFDEQQQRLCGVICQSWHGGLLLQAPLEDGALAPLLDALPRYAPRPLAGFIGPWPQIVAAKAHLGLEHVSYKLDKPERLYALELAKLRVPEPIATQRWRVARAKAEQLELLSQWQVGFAIEALKAKESPQELLAGVQEELARHIQNETVFVLTQEDGQEVAMSSFNATLPEAVQIGGVWTPEMWRSRGFARAAVAGQLQIARDEGKRLATLFTAVDNTPAQRAYEAIGFVEVGTYGLSFLEHELPLHPS